MARRYDHSRDQLLEMALDASRTLVLENGVRALTVRKVAGEMGYAVGTIYNLFANLDDLILHVNGATLDALYDTLSDVPLTADADKDVRALSAAYIDFTITHLNLWNALFEHSLPAGEDLPDWYHEKITRLLKLLETALAPIFNGQNPTELEKAARVLWSSLHGICSLATVNKLDIVTAAPALDLTDSLITNYLLGLSQTVSK
ncbi:TetR/AcrR family transcriptional regulator [Terasakiella pusilla]|uniref:TetR/AcrR family transcriptional regulator n=1 Tax=Terasakiella pusilla TaxID=64973 RepID=UPI003AA807F1